MSRTSENSSVFYSSSDQRNHVSDSSLDSNDCITDNSGQDVTTEGSHLHSEYIGFSSVEQKSMNGKGIDLIMSHIIKQKDNQTGEVSSEPKVNTIDNSLIVHFSTPLVRYNENVNRDLNSSLTIDNKDISLIADCNESDIAIIGSSPEMSDKINDLRKPELISSTKKNIVRNWLTNVSLNCSIKPTQRGEIPSKHASNPGNNINLFTPRASGDRKNNDLFSCSNMSSKRASPEKVPSTTCNSSTSYNLVKSPKNVAKPYNLRRKPGKENFQPGKTDITKIVSNMLVTPNDCKSQRNHDTKLFNGSLNDKYSTPLNPGRKFVRNRRGRNNLGTFCFDEDDMSEIMESVMNFQMTSDDENCEGDMSIDKRACYAESNESPQANHIKVFGSGLTSNNNEMVIPRKKLFSRNNLNNSLDSSPQKYYVSISGTTPQIKSLKSKGLVAFLENSFNSDSNSINDDVPCLSTGKQDEVEHSPQYCLQKKPGNSETFNDCESLSDASLQKLSSNKLNENGGNVSSKDYQEVTIHNMETNEESMTSSDEDNNFRFVHRRKTPRKAFLHDSSDENSYEYKEPLNVSHGNFYHRASNKKADLSESLKCDETSKSVEDFESSSEHELSDHSEKIKELAETDQSQKRCSVSLASIDSLLSNECGDGENDSSLGSNHTRTEARSENTYTPQLDSSDFHKALNYRNSGETEQMQEDGKHLESSILCGSDKEGVANTSSECANQLDFSKRATACDQSVIFISDNDDSFSNIIRSKTPLRNKICVIVSDEERDLSSIKVEIDDSWKTLSKGSSKSSRGKKSDDKYSPDLLIVQGTDSSDASDIENDDVIYKENIIESEISSDDETESDAPWSDLASYLKKNIPANSLPLDSSFARRKKRVLADVQLPSYSGCSEHTSFLLSLNENVPLYMCHPEAIKYRESFNVHKENLIDLLFKLYNKEIFDSMMPPVDIKWSGHLTTTSGITKSSSRITNTGKIRTSGIKLSKTVVDNASKLRDVLLHELCHVANWQIDQQKGGHGPLFKKWANKARLRFPEIPKVSTFHRYELKWKYLYKCSYCGYEVGKMKLSLKNESCRLCGAPVTVSSN